MRGDDTATLGPTGVASGLRTARARARGVSRTPAAQEAPRVPAARGVGRKTRRHDPGSVDGEDAGRLVAPGASRETIHDGGKRHETGVIEDGTRPEELEASAAGR